MKTHNAIVILILTSIFLGSVPLRDKTFQMQKSLNEAISNYEMEILKLCEDKDYREAIQVAGKYEQDVLSLYTPPSYHMGLLQSESQHVSFHSHFDSWKQVGIEELGVPKELTIMGFNILLSLEGKSEEERFAVFCIDADRLESHIGDSSSSQLLVNDRGLIILGKMFAGNFGMVRNHYFNKIGEHRALILDVASQFTGPDIRIVLLTKHGRMFMYLLLSSAGDIESNESLLFDTIKTTSFDYKPEDSDAIARIRSRHKKKDISWMLNCIKALTEIGQYGAAAEDLTGLKHLLYPMLPHPSVKGQVAHCPAYGITLTNPDSDRWALNVLQEGAMQMILLEDKLSVKQEGIGVAVIDLLMAYGADIVNLFKDETTAKEYLINGGRGGASVIGSIEEESFAHVRGKLAYEAIVIPNMPSLKARIQFINMGDYAVMLFALIDKNDFTAKLIELDRIINSDFLKFDTHLMSKQTKYGHRVQD